MNIQKQYITIFQKIKTIERLLKDGVDEEKTTDIEDSVEKSAEAIDGITIHDKKEKSGSACVSLEHEKVNIVRPKVKQPKTVKPKSKEQVTHSHSEANLLTFSRQKLALIHCDYDPKFCNSCGKQGTSQELALKNCSKCKVARYCSQQCQTKDWVKRHKTDCKEIKRLEAIMEQLQSTVTSPELPITKRLKATLQRKPLRLQQHRKFPGVLEGMYLHGDRLIFGGYIPHPLIEPTRYISIHNASTGISEGSYCEMSKDYQYMGKCVLNIEGTLYLALTVVYVPSYNGPSRFELWSYPKPSRKPRYTITGEPETFGALHYFDGNLLIVNENKKIIEEYDVNSIPVKPTHLTIPTGLKDPAHVQTFCGIVQDGDKLLVLQCADGKGDSAAKCINYEGEIVWILGGLTQPPLDGSPFTPHGPCTDNNGNIFMQDQENPRIVVARRDLGLQTLIALDWWSTGMAWCNNTDTLFVSHAIKDQIIQLLSKYVIKEE